MPRNDKLKCKDGTCGSIECAACNPSSRRAGKGTCADCGTNLVKYKGTWACPSCDIPEEYYYYHDQE